MSPLYNPPENGQVLFVPASADFNIASVTPVTIAIKNNIEMLVGDKYEVETYFTVLNESGATRVLTFRITIPFSGTFLAEVVTGALATSVTLRHPFHIRTVFDIRTNALGYQVIEASGFTAAGIASSGNPTMAATMLSAMGWEENTSDFTGTQAIQFVASSAAAVDTQTLRLHHFSIRRFRNQL